MCTERTRENESKRSWTERNNVTSSLAKFNEETKIYWRSMKNRNVKNVVKEMKFFSDRGEDGILLFFEKKNIFFYFLLKKFEKINLKI